MDRIPNWEQFRRVGGRASRLRLSPDEWESKVLALGCEGFKLAQIEGIMTEAHDLEKRTKWDIGPGHDAKWCKADTKRAMATIWGFLREDIQNMYQGNGCKPLSPGSIVNRIKSETGFVLPESTMLQQLISWEIPRRGRGGGPSKAKTTRGTNKSNIPLRVPTQPVPTQPVPTRPVPIDTAPLAINANTIRPGPQSQRAIPSHPPSRIPTIATPISPSSPAPHITVAPPQPSPAVEAAGNMCRLELLVQEVDSQRLKLESQRVEMEEYMHAQEKINKTQDENYARMFEAAQDQAQTFQKENQRMVRENTSLRTQIAELRKQNDILQAQHQIHVQQANREMDDLRHRFSAMQHKFSAVMAENSALKAEKAREQYRMKYLLHHLRKLLARSNTHCSKAELGGIVASLNNLNLDSDRRLSNDSGIYSASQQSSNKRRRQMPEHMVPPAMGRSISAGQQGNPGLMHPGFQRQAFTDPRSLDSASVMGRDEQFMMPATPGDIGMDMGILKREEAVKVAQGGNVWADAIPGPEMFDGEGVGTGVPRGEVLDTLMYLDGRLP